MFDRIKVTALLVALVATCAPALANLPGQDALPWELRQALEAPIKKWVGEQTKEKNADGKKFKRSVYSKAFRKIDDDTYMGSAHINTAGDTSMTTERYELKLTRKSKDQWEVGEATVADTYVGLHRAAGIECYPFKSFDFDREGLTLGASNGTVCETFFMGKVTQIIVLADEFDYDYTVPDHALRIALTHDFSELHERVSADHEREIYFDPKYIGIACGPETCEELMNASFTGVTRLAPEDRPTASRDDIPTDKYPSIVRKLLEDSWKEKRDNPFFGFRPPPTPGHGYWSIRVGREADVTEPAGTNLTWDEWAGWEVTFSVTPRRQDVNIRGPLYGYYSEKTLAENDAYEIESREDSDSRWHEVYSVKGSIDAALEDPETIKGDIEFGITLKQDLKELPFFIASIPEATAFGDNTRSTLFVNSVQLDGEELTWIRTNPFGGRIVLPEEMPAGSLITLRMQFSARALYKENHAYSGMNRGGWLPFVRFADFIDEFELTVRVPSQYELLGIGHKVEEHIEGDVLVSHWRSDSPVVFPTIIFGKYVSKKPKAIVAKKLDGTVVPVEVHVDEVSMGITEIAITTGKQLQETAESFSAGARGIRPSQLVPIAEQAAASINLYSEISGVDYPYGELNLVNDPAPALYGQAPSSLIYLGSFVFRGEGTMAGDTTFGGGGTRTAKFLKSVTAHEVGHQWWGSRVSNSNTRNYWFVETLAEYFSGIYLERAFGRQEYLEQVDEWRNNILNSEMKQSVQNASTLWQGEDGGRSYQSAVYSKGPYAFHMLREIFGDEKFFDFLKKFSMELTEKREIVSLDIERAAEKGLGGIGPDGQPYTVDLSWFFDQWLRGIGIPQYRLVYDQRQAEDGGWVIEGKIEQRVVIGNKASMQVVPDKFYRGIANLTVKTKGEDYQKRFPIEGQWTPFALKVPGKPLEVALNKNGESLSHDTVVNQNW